MRHQPIMLELDRNGVPIYNGNAETFDAWQERALDLLHCRAGNHNLQASTAIALRGGLRDTASDAARKIPHGELPAWTGAGDTAVPKTASGVDTLIGTVKTMLA